MRELIHETDRDGFKIRFYIEPETDAPEGHIATGNDRLDKEWCDKIRNGQLCWFVACVTASRAGVELGASYLGGCDYADPADFVEDLHFECMANEAIEEAREKIEMIARETA